MGCLLFAAVHSYCQEPLKLFPANPHYLSYKYKPLLLITAGEHYGALINLDFDFIPYSVSQVTRYPAEIAGQVFQSSYEKEVEVIGVVEDFRFRMPSEQDKIGPLILRHQENQFRFVQLKINSNGGC